MSENLLHSFHQVATFAARHRSFAAFSFVLLGVVLLDVVFHNFLFEGYAALVKAVFGSTLGKVEEVDMGFAPEVWLALLSMVLGTLIIVISIASQSIPKLIDLYMEDWASLLYVWFLIVSGGHAAFIKLYGEMELLRASSRVLNIHFLLTTSTILAFPYIFYILKYTKPSNVIHKIFVSSLRRIHSLMQAWVHTILNIPSLVEEYQFGMFEAMNQLDDLLEYVSFKEPKADIIQNMSTMVQEYVEIKEHINPAFFHVSPKVRLDISFKTMIGQFGEMEKTHTFYEQKCLRLLGNVYIKLLEQGQFDLASLCVGEHTAIGGTAIKMGDDQLVDVLIIRFNTLLRFAIKHGVKNNEPRNLYNAAFHYGAFVDNLARTHKIEYVKRTFMYMRIYGTEVFKHGRSSPAMYFIVDVFAAEMKKILILAYNEKWDIDIQNSLLTEMLQVDSPPDFNREDLDRGLLINNGVRVLQMGLGLFYLREKMYDFVNRVILDILDDLDVLGELTFRRVVNATSNRLKFSGPTFWEDTDRGNLNMYYTSDQALIDPFKEMLFEKMEDRILAGAQKQHGLTDDECKFLVQLSKLTDAQEITCLVEDPKTFEKALLQIQEFDPATIANLDSLRTKLKFTTENPKLVVFTTRQIARNIDIRVTYRDPQQKKTMTVPAKLAINSISFFYLRFGKGFSAPDHLLEMENVSFRFKPPRQKNTYQFESRFAGVLAEKKLFKVLHVDNMQIISEDQ